MQKKIQTDNCVIYRNLDKVPQKSNAACQNDRKTFCLEGQNKLNLTEELEQEQDGSVLVTHLIKEKFEI